MIKASISVRKVKSLETNDFSDKKVLDAGPGERILIGSLDRQYFLEILEVTASSVLIKPENLIVYSKEENIKDLGNEIPLNIGQTILLAEAVANGIEKWEIGLVACLDKNAPINPMPPIIPFVTPPPVIPLPVVPPVMPPPVISPVTPPPVVKPITPPITSSLSAPLNKPLNSPLPPPLSNFPPKPVQNPPFTNPISRPPVIPLRPAFSDFPKMPLKIEEKKTEEIKTKGPVITKTFEIESNISVDNIESLLESDLYQLMEKIVLELQRRLTNKK